MKEKIRKLKHWLQKIFRGVGDDELWSLDFTLAKLIYPRLKAFRETTVSYPTNLEDFNEWQDILDKMLYSFEFLASDDKWDNFEKEASKEIQEGVELFGKYFMHLWS